MPGAQAGEARQVTKYPLDGLNLDRIRYAANDYCHCDYCKSAFQRDTGVALAGLGQGGGVHGDHRDALRARQVGGRAHEFECVTARGGCR